MIMVYGGFPFPTTAWQFGQANTAVGTAKKIIKKNDLIIASR